MNRDDKCEICRGEGWVCEYHRNRGWSYGQGCCGGAGTPCECNTSDPPWEHFDTSKESDHIRAPILH